jgi:hypothetical protein
MIMALPPDARDDPFRPPCEACQVECIHCGQRYSSDEIVWHSGKDGKGFWCCPIEGCDGAGFGFDIWPLKAEAEAEEEEYDQDDPDF